VQEVDFSDTGTSRRSSAPISSDPATSKRRAQTFTTVLGRARPADITVQVRADGVSRWAPSFPAASLALSV